MKKLALLVLIILTMAAPAAIAASSMNATLYSISDDQNTMTIKVACVAHTDGAFTDTYPNGKTIEHADLFPSGQIMPAMYWDLGYRISNAYAVNPASGYPTLPAAVTITGANGKVLVGATVTDTLVLSTSTYGKSYLSIDRGGGQRLVVDKLNVSVGDTGTAANTFDLYIEFERFR